MQPKLLVQSLQGTRAQILFAFLFAGHAMDVEELMTWTGRDRKIHYRHLKALCGAGLLGEQMLAHGRRVYLIGSEMLPALQAWIAQIGAGAPLLESSQESLKWTPAGVNVVVDHLSLNSPTITTTTTTESQESTLRTPAEWAELKEALDEYQIIGKKRRDLIACEWINAQYVRASVEYARNEPQWDNPVGMAITRMLENVTIPVMHENGHPGNCKCTTCTVDNFFRHDSLLCETCHQNPCVCDEHDDDCMCINCRRDHPERFCSFHRINGHGEFRICNAYVEPGHRFCGEHENDESENL